MISKTQITKRTEKKQNPHIIETIALAKKNNLLELAKKLSSPKSNYTNINLEELNKIEENSIIVVVKVLGSGNIHKKITISALSFSKQALEGNHVVIVNAEKTIITGDKNSIVAKYHDLRQKGQKHSMRGPSIS